MRTCSKCKKSKSINSFHKNKSIKGGLAGWCKECQHSWYKKYYQNNKNKYRNYKLKQNYGITLEQYNQILKKQKGCCGICGKHQFECRRALSVDHNHLTGHIRGLLCDYCNRRLLKYFRDKKNNWRGFVKYAQQAIENDKDWK